MCRPSIITSSHYLHILILSMHSINYVYYILSSPYGVQRDTENKKPNKTAIIWYSSPGP